MLSKSMTLVLTSLVFYSCGQQNYHLNAPVPKQDASAEKALFAFARDYSGTYVLSNKQESEITESQSGTCGGQVILEGPNDAQKDKEKMEHVFFNSMTKPKANTTWLGHMTFSAKNIGVTGADEDWEKSAFYSFRREDFGDNQLTEVKAFIEEDVTKGFFESFQITLGKNKEPILKCIHEAFEVKKKWLKKDFETFVSKRKPYDKDTPVLEYTKK